MFPRDQRDQDKFGGRANGLNKFRGKSSAGQLAAAEQRLALLELVQHQVWCGGIERQAQAFKRVT